ncbi:hypothetical protein [Rhodoblastus acidophilus]|uniref:hypothetical protein n=1 Tax=Rhodoblastus acidophilus TaxID=1074 RepID=UPI000D4ED9E4|nr:hypothetical protein [Rhodoblastus acidophilus]PPQ35162.1 hypothetical protein CKO16_21035 [Rhodoblastus acidophilus]RAI16908.1 hypothetical protein CH337_18960 [Rhodoblastus acidophilus]
MDDYLWRDKSAPVSALRAILKEHFLPFDRVAIIGGMVRDLARAGKRGFKSDVDLVVDAPVEDVKKLAIDLNATPNRFGGYCYKTSRWKIDFWALRTTWAYTEGHASLDKIEDVTHCTFFDWDSVIYDLKRRHIVCCDDYLERIKGKTIEVCLRPTPSVNGNLLRAVRRIILWDLEPGPLLHAFIDENLTDHNFQEIAKLDRTVYTWPLIAKFECAERLRRHVCTPERRAELGTEYARQLSLPGFSRKHVVA